MSRTVPYSVEAEESVIGCILIQPALLGSLRDVLDPGDFWKQPLGSVYAAALDLHAEGKPVDVVTIAALGTTGMSTMDLHQLTVSTPAISRARAYADIVIRHSRQRRLVAHCSDAIEMCYENTDPDDVLGMLGTGDQLLQSRRVEIEGLFGIEEFMQLAERQDDNKPWLIPHVMKARWRVVVVAGEGVGKAVLMRFLALHVAAGRDPWDARRFIEPRRCLYIDCENGISSIRHQIRIANRMTDVQIVKEASEHLTIWHREAGLELRERRPLAELEAVLQKVRPEIVFAGPLYKLFDKRKGENDEDAAKAITKILDDLRVRYGFALMLEHHAPKGGNGHRDMIPFGSSAWMRWPEFGITLEAMGNPLPEDEHVTYEIGRFRGDREIADWPTTITKGAPMSYTAWQPQWRLGRGQRLVNQGITL